MLDGEVSPFGHPSLDIRGMVNRLDRFEKLVNCLSSWLNWVAGVALVGMLVLILADVIGSKLFNWPLPGAFEIVSFSCVVVIAFAIAQTQIIRGHIEVEFLTTRLPGIAQRVIGGIIYLAGMILFAFIAWTSYEFGRTLQVSGEVSMTERIPFYPFVYGIAFCSVMVFLVLLVQGIRTVTKMKE